MYVMVRYAAYFLGGLFDKLWKPVILILQKDENVNVKFNFKRN